MSLTKINVNNTQVTEVDDEPTVGSDNLVKSGGVFPFTTLKYNDIKSSSDYSDFNDVPIGTITTFAGVTNIAHAPTTSIGGTLICTSNKNTVINGGALQIFISQYHDTGGCRMYYRLYWGDSSGWSEWKTVAYKDEVDNLSTTVALKYNPGTKSSSDYDDLDNVPVGTVSVFVGLLGIAHAPTTLNNVGGTLIHTSGSNSQSSAGSVQIFITQHLDTKGCRMYYRHNWGDGSGWSEWTRIPMLDEINDEINDKLNNTVALKYNNIKSSSDYDDFDTIPVGTITTFAGVTDIAHAPTTSIGGTLIHTHCRTTVAGGGALQIFMTQHKDTNGCHIYYRLHWGDGSGWSEWKTVVNIDEVNELISQKQDVAYNTVSSFLRISVIGDSYASGLIYPNYPSSTAGVEAWSISWIQQLARINGVTGINYSKSGVTCKSWWNSPICRAKLEADEPCDLYYLVLGLNDAAEDRDGQTLGEPEDMDYVGENPPNTFYYNYAQIVKCVQTKAPKAKLIFVEMASNSGRRAVYNTAIRTIAEHFSIPCMAEYNDPFFKTSYYTSHMISGHPTTQIYGGMAKAIERMTQKCMYDNADYFNTIIPTDIL